MNNSEKNFHHGWITIFNMISAVLHENVENITYVQIWDLCIVNNYNKL